MKLLTLSLLGVLAFTACSKTTTAFDFFKMDEQHEAAVTNLRTGTIVRSFETEAIISSIYLNNVIPQDYNTTEAFYIALYIKDDQRIYFKKSDEQRPDYKVNLNAHEALRYRELKRDDKLRSLMPIQNEWNRYYLVEFEKEDNTTLELHLVNSRNDQVTLTYRKEVK